MYFWCNMSLYDIHQQNSTFPISVPALFNTLNYIYIHSTISVGPDDKKIYICTAYLIYRYLQTDLTLSDKTAADFEGV